MSMDDRAFNPIGYHTGIVWPHDNSIVAAGLVRYGFRDEANRIAVAMFDADGSMIERTVHLSCPKLKNYGGPSNNN